jgi:hypothetical protein
MQKTYEKNGCCNYAMLWIYFIQTFSSNSLHGEALYSASPQKVAIQNGGNMPVIGNANEMNFSKTALANLPG